MVLITQGFVVSMVPHHVSQETLRYWLVQAAQLVD